MVQMTARHFTSVATGDSQWHYSDVQWFYGECHRTGCDEWSDLQCQCGG